MPRFVKKGKKPGLPPGTLVHVGEKKLDKPKISALNYTPEKVEEIKADSIEQCFALNNPSSVTWINIDGIHDMEMIKKTGDFFGLHPLILEDIVNTGQRPKFENFEDYFFLILKMLYYDKAKKEIRSEQVSIVAGKTFVLSFQEIEGDVFNTIRERLKNSQGKFRKQGTDYLSYAIIDAIVDGYFHILEFVGEQIELLEEKLVSNPKPKMLAELHELKREMLFLRRAVWPLREAISSLQRSESKLIDKKTSVYFRDVYDHTIQVIDTVETLREMLAGMLDIYLSSLSNKMNEVMKVLTVIATIFIPLTFITGIYGMNFEFMPELESVLGYPAALGLMLVVGLLMIVYFKKKKWL